MNVPTLLSEIARIHAYIEDADRQKLNLMLAKETLLKKLGPILGAGLDADNFPLRLQLVDGYELRVQMTTMENPSNCGVYMTVNKSENLDQATLMTLLEGIEE